MNGNEIIEMFNKGNWRCERGADGHLHVRHLTPEEIAARDRLAETGTAADIQPIPDVEPEKMDVKDVVEEHTCPYCGGKMHRLGIFDGYYCMSCNKILNRDLHWLKYRLTDEDICHLLDGEVIRIPHTSKRGNPCWLGLKVETDRRLCKFDGSFNYRTSLLAVEYLKD